MKTIMLALLSIIMLALRISAQSLPDCAAPCSTFSIADTGCHENDASCICNSPSYYSDLVSCAKISCSEADQELAMESIVRFCMQPGVSHSEPTSAAAVDAKGTAVTTTASASSTAFTPAVAGSIDDSKKAATGAASFVKGDHRFMAIVGFTVGLLLC